MIPVPGAGLHDRSFAERDVGGIHGVAQLPCHREVEALAHPYGLVLECQKNVALPSGKYTLIFARLVSRTALQAVILARKLLLEGFEEAPGRVLIFHRELYSSANDAVVLFSAGVADLRCAA